MEPIKAPELTLGQRFAADTPLLFKKIGIIGLALAAAGTGLTQTAGIPSWIGPTVIAIGGTMNLLSNITVKDTSVLANPNATIEDYSAVLADLPNQFAALHAGINNTVAAINSGKLTPEVPVTETPIVKEPVVGTTTIDEVKASIEQSKLAAIAPASTTVVDPSAPAPVINPII